MHQWDLSPFSVTPAASLLSKCVSVGALSQVRTRTSPVFSSHLQEAEDQIRMQKQLDEVCMRLRLELLQVDEQSADVAHSFHLAQRFQMLQMLGDHMQELLREQNSLRQRLMKPLACTNLPVHAHLHRFMVESLKLMMDFIETLEEKLIHPSSTVTSLSLSQDSSLAQLLIQASEMETLSSQILQWKSVDGCNLVTSDP
uniref:HAUS augmin like complex subunit 2 n=1 Tax=Maylandia zebra TaxID=106582 RepID=A0A3P9DR60_9CICH